MCIPDKGKGRGILKASLGLHIEAEGCIRGIEDD